MLSLTFCTLSRKATPGLEFDAAAFGHDWGRKFDLDSKKCEQDPVDELFPQHATVNPEQQPNHRKEIIQELPCRDKVPASLYKV